jgi:glycosyltransferase involved in cell wall biosynthesis
VRILVVNWQDRLNPQAGGAEIHLHEVFGRLARWGHTVTLLVSGFAGGPSRERVDGMEVHRVGGRLTFTARAGPYLKSSLAGFDVAVEDLNKVPLFLPVWTNTPSVLLVHHLFGSTAFQEASLPMALATWLLERPLPRVYAGRPVVTVSRSTMEDLERRGFERALMTVVPNGVDLAHYAPAPEEEPYRDPTLLYLGRLKRYKRIDLVVEAVGILRGRGVGCRLLVAGQGDHGPELARLVDERGLGEQVELLGYVEEEQKVRLLRKAWIHVLTSPKEGWGIANMEAAACGTPTVASDSPGLRDSVRDGETGILVPHGDVVALADALQRLLTHHALRKRMGKRARAFAEGFSWDASAREMEAVLERRLATAPRPE